MLLKLGPFSKTLTYTLILLFKNSSASILPENSGARLSQACEGWI